MPSFNVASSAAPGVRVQWFDTNAQQLDPGRTDVAGFIGVAERGPLHSARKVESQRQFATLFGGPIAHGYLAYAVNGFFANGGQTCWVVRVADPAQAAPGGLTLVLPDGSTLRLEASSAGAWGNEVEIVPVWSGGSVAQLVARQDGRPEQRIRLGGAVIAAQPDATSPPSGQDEPSQHEELLVQAVAVGGSPAPAVRLVPGLRSVRLSDGQDGLATLLTRHLTGDGEGRCCWGMDALSRVDGVSLVAVPDLLFEPPAGTQASARPSFNAADIRSAQRELLSACMRRRDRIVLLDLPRGDRGRALEHVGAPQDGDGATGFGAAYHPWIVVDEPLGPRGMVRTMPPSGHVAGMFARTDRLRGVHKPPANEVLEGVWALAEDIDDPGHAALNEAGINALRSLPGRGIRVMGARTLSADPRWRYVNVRRLFAMIEESLQEQLQWVVFEPNGQRLWREVDRAVRGLLQRLHHAGMLDGASPEEAFFVRCDEASQGGAAGSERLVCEVGLQPPWPAEFIEVRIGVVRNGIRIEAQETRNG